MLLSRLHLLHDLVFCISFHVLFILLHKFASALMFCWDCVQLQGLVFCCYLLLACLFFHVVFIAMLLSRLHLLHKFASGSTLRFVLFDSTWFVSWLLFLLYYWVLRLFSTEVVRLFLLCLDFTEMAVLRWLVLRSVSFSLYWHGFCLRLFLHWGGSLLSCFDFTEMAVLRWFYVLCLDFTAAEIRAFFLSLQFYSYWWWFCLFSLFLSLVIHITMPMVYYI